MEGRPWSQHLVLGTMDSIEAELDIITWMDVFRMDVGQSANAEMEDGVKNCAVAVVFLDAMYPTRCARHHMLPIPHALSCGLTMLR